LYVSFKKRSLREKSGNSKKRQGFQKSARRAPNSQIPKTDFQESALRAQILKCSKSRISKKSALRAQNSRIFKNWDSKRPALRAQYSEIIEEHLGS
jgi:hypothetical protein